MIAVAAALFGSLFGSVVMLIAVGFVVASPWGWSVVELWLICSFASSALLFLVAMLSARRA